jgi:hypothetical protein
MRWMIPVLALAACTEPVGVEDTAEPLTFALDEELPPPGQPLVLTVGQASAGAPLSITISNADPGESVRLVRSSAMGVGPCPPALGGLCLDVAAPTVMGPYTASGAGVAALSPTLPAALPMATNICLQAVAARGPGGVNSVKSPVVCRVSNNGPVTLEGGANTGDTFSSSTTMGGPNLSFAMKYTAPTQLVVGYVEVFTGLLAGANDITIWSHDAANNQPLAPQATTSWNMTANEEWQGGSLGQRFIMPQGSTWWIVWEPQNSARATRDTAGTPVDYRGSFTGGAPWSGPFSNTEKFKLCGGGGCP